MIIKNYNIYYMPNYIVSYYNFNLPNYYKL